ncbi:MAG TPA: protease modulator HflC [bacterium]|nr:protease modulator HflC [bacterium]
MRKTLAVLIVIALAVWLVSLCIFTVSEREIVIITRFGRPIGQPVSEAGPHLKLPGFIDTVNRLDRRIQVFKTLPIQLLLGDKNPIIMTCYVTWRIASPLKFFQSVTTAETARQKLEDMINARLGSVLGDFTLSQIINVDPEKVELGEIERLILTEAGGQAAREYGLEIVDVGICRLSYPSIVTNAVYNRMKAEREKEAKKYRAEGLEEAAAIEADADKQAAEVRAQAYKEAEIVKGEGDAEAIRIYAEAYGRDPDFYRFLDTMETYKKILGKETTLILSTGSELFRYLAPLPSPAPPEASPTP